jgi:DNA/RNA-binding domain of Phe-tRNA-synthetase-like protein
LKIEPRLLEKYPGLQVLELTMSGLRINKSGEELAVFRKAKQEEIRTRIPYLESVKNLPVIRAYRDFYWNVGIDPTKTRPAGEALLRRILGGRDLPIINSLVDSYNIASAETMISIAAFDLDRIDDQHLLMRTAANGEDFLGIGMDSPVSLTGVEVVIEDVSNRKLIAVYPYRDADESKVSEQTSKVLFMMCGVPGIESAELETAKARTKDYVWKFCGGSE